MDQPAPFRLFFPPWPLKERSSSSSPTSSSSSSPLLLVSIVLYSLSVTLQVLCMVSFLLPARSSTDRPTNVDLPTAPGPQPRLPTSSLLQAFSFDYNTLTHTEKNHADGGGFVSSGRSGRRPGVGTGWLSASAGFETGDAARMQLTARFFLCLTCRDAIISCCCPYDRGFALHLARLDGSLYLCTAVAKPGATRDCSFLWACRDVCTR